MGSFAWIPLAFVLMSGPSWAGVSFSLEPADELVAAFLQFKGREPYLQLY
jgi:hypothetical protein